MNLQGSRTSVIDEVFSYTLSKLNCYFHSENSAFSSPKDTLTARYKQKRIGEVKKKTRFHKTLVYPGAMHDLSFEPDSSY